MPVDESTLKTPDGPSEPCPPPDELLAWMSEQFARFGDIYKASIYGRDAYVVRDPTFARHVLVDHWTNYVKGQLNKRVAILLGDGLMASEGELWRRRRRMIQPGFHRAAVAGLTAPIVAANRDLLARWESAAGRAMTINVSAEVSRTVLDVTLRLIFGDGADYRSAAAAFAVLTEDRQRSLGLVAAFRDARRVVAEIVARRQADAAVGQDILALIMAARDRDTGAAMTPPELVNEVLTLIVAGHETTATTLAWAWDLLSRHEAADAALAASLALADDSGSLDAARAHAGRVIEETMRLFPAGWLVTRRAVADDAVAGYRIPAGSEIYIPAYFIQRHPAIWRDPDRFDPDRFLGPPEAVAALLPFSWGPRNCIGEHLARAEMQIHLSLVAKHLRLRRIAVEPVVLDAGINLRSKADIVLAPEMREARRP